MIVTLIKPEDCPFKLPGKVFVGFAGGRPSPWPLAMSEDAEILPDGFSELDYSKLFERDLPLYYMNYSSYEPSTGNITTDGKVRKAETAMLKSTEGYKKARRLEINGVTDERIRVGLNEMGIKSEVQQLRMALKKLLAATGKTDADFSAYDLMISGHVADGNAQKTADGV